MKAHEIVLKLMEKQHKKPKDIYPYLGISFSTFYQAIRPDKRTYKRKNGKGSEIGLEFLCPTLDLLGYKLVAVPKHRVPEPDEIDLELSNFIDTSTKAEKEDGRSASSKENAKVARAKREEQLLAKGIVMNHEPKKPKHPVEDDGTEIELSEEALWKQKLSDFD